jgi:hypothetical protein
VREEKAQMHGRAAINMKITKSELVKLIKEELDADTFLELSRQPFEGEYPIGRAFPGEYPWYEWAADAIGAGVPVKPVKLPQDLVYVEPPNPFADEWPIGRAFPEKPKPEVLVDVEPPNPFADEWPTDVLDRPRPEALVSAPELPLREELFGSTEEELEEESYNDPVYQVNDIFVSEASKAAIKGLVGMSANRWRLTRETAEPAVATLTDKVISAVQRIAGIVIPRPNREAFRNMIKLELQEPLHALLTRQALSLLPTYRPGGVGGATLEDLPRYFFQHAKADMEVPLMDMLLPIAEEAYRISEQGRGRGPQKSLF